MSSEQDELARLRAENAALREQNAALQKRQRQLGHDNDDDDSAAPTADSRRVFCSHVGHLSKDQVERYSRQALLPDCGPEGTRAFLDARVVVVGCGGLGSTAILYLAAAGVGHLVLVDNDVVDRSNLHRQIIHPDSRVGTPKVESAKASALALNPTIQIDTWRSHLTPDNALQIVGGADLVVDCTDNMSARFLINDVCVRLGMPFVSGAAERWNGTLTVYNMPLNAAKSRWSPTYRCMQGRGRVPPAPAGGCSDIGVLGPVPGVIGCLQAVEVLKVLIVFHQRRKQLQAPAAQENNDNQKLNLLEKKEDCEHIMAERILNWDALTPICPLSERKNSQTKKDHYWMSREALTRERTATGVEESMKSFFPAEMGNGGVVVAIGESSSQADSSDSCNHNDGNRLAALGAPYNGNCLRIPEIPSSSCIGHCDASEIFDLIRECSAFSTTNINDDVQQLPIRRTRRLIARVHFIIDVRKKIQFDLCNLTDLYGEFPRVATQPPHETEESDTGVRGVVCYGNFPYDEMRSLVDKIDRERNNNNIAAARSRGDLPCTSLLLGEDAENSKTSPALVEYCKTLCSLFERMFPGGTDTLVKVMGDESFSQTNYFQFLCRRGQDSVSAALLFERVMGTAFRVMCAVAEESGQPHSITRSLVNSCSMIQNIRGGLNAWSLQVDSRFPLY